MKLGKSVLVIGLCAAAACTSGDDGGSGKGDGDGDRKTDGWDYAGSPERFGVELSYQLSALPTDGRAEHVPWSETYWPTTDDSFNHRWDGADTLSPLEKFDMAFNGWTPPPGFMDLRPLTPDNCASGQWDPEYYEALGPAARYWSEVKGNGRARNGVDDDGDGRIDECDDLDGMEYWWGSCHAWTPASMLEKEPLEPVTIGGITFQVSDIKALVILLYDESLQVAIGDRCNLSNPPRDEHGRIIDSSCRNTNAGAFHLLLTNLVGLQARPFGEDRVSDIEVWNQPILGYRVTAQSELDLAGAMRVLGLEGDVYPYNDEAVSFAEVRVDVDYVVETHPSRQPTTPIIDQFVRTDRYHYLLELDGDGNIIGGEWLSGRANTPVAVNDRPDYLWLAFGPGRNPNPHVSSAQVRELQRLSRPDTRNQQLLVFEDDVDTLIPDWPSPGLVRTIDVAEDLTISTVTVRAEVLHDWAFDVQIYLHRGSDKFLLFDRNPVGSSTAINGTWTVPALAGASSAGEWKLEVVDRDGRSRGRFVRWALEIAGSGGDVDPEPDPDPEPQPRDMTFSSTGAPVAIPDYDTTGASSSIAVPETGKASKVEVTVDIAHTYRGDLRVVLEHGGVTQVLHDRTGGSADDLKQTFEADIFAGALIEGAWKLSVTDHYRQDTGTINGWSLRIMTDE